MLDLETLGTRPGSVITSIGAVKFAAGQITSDFYVRIDMQSSVEAGLVIDPATLLWWLQRSEKARSELLAPSVPLRSALEAFRVWVGDPDSEVWAAASALTTSCSTPPMLTFRSSPRGNIGMTAATAPSKTSTPPSPSSAPAPTTTPSTTPDIRPFT